MSGRRVTVRAFAKINLALRVLATRPDGFHEVRTTLQSIALHDVLTFTRTRAAFTIECDDPRLPVDDRNLVWQAAARLWRAVGRSGRPAGVSVRIDKRIPVAAGLGGGSADAAAALRALAALWRVNADADWLRAIAASLGADVPYFLEGGTALGLERGDVVFPLADAPPRWVALIVPPFGVSTPEAYRWWDEATLKGSRHDRHTDVARASQARRAADVARAVQARQALNDLQPPVVRRHPEIGRIVRALERAGASQAAMSGSGSAVFGLFGTRAAAEAAAGDLAAPQWRAIVTRSLSRSEHARRAAPRLARK